jgi:hypothetical protein
MKIRRDAVTNSAEPGSRDEVRELAEALSLWRSAVHHVTDRQLERPFAARPVPAVRSRSFRLGLVLAPALSAAVAAGVLVPVYSHFHHQRSSPAQAASAAVQPVNPVRAGMDDTALMNQIDSDLSQDVPDALLPLADLSRQATTTTAPTENKNASQK